MSVPAADHPTDIEIRLSWRSLVLPALAFCALLVLLVTGGEAQAAPSLQPAAEFLHRLHETLLR
ncbi:hypothetical protein [Streptomyces avicenniae]|uniref:hypothetical protein n=1 Tax=Streptomyces avicenniae TaxID=500153 RepID=UPI001CBA6A44|nr:hypothetical protein [Streptomyces avicenniae]